MRSTTDPAPVHRYRSTLTWAGSTGAGYEAYDRSHSATTPPADGAVRLSADPAFRGDPTLANPEQLVLLAASSCQLLSFLAVAARARLDVVGYEDDAEAEMDEAQPPTRITAIRLRPRITLATGPTEDRVRRLVAVAHRECFVARSLETPIVVDPAIAFVPPGTSAG